MTPIIAAVDFSPPSRNAARYAADLAVSMKTELLLVNVVQIPVTISEVPGSGYLLDEMTNDSETELNGLKDELSGRVKEEIKIRTRTTVGSVSHSLQAEGKKEKAFCIVLGADSATAAEHLIVTNHALAAIQSVSVPVLIVPQSASFRTIKKVVVASELREPGNITCLQLLKEWLKAFKPALDIVKVVRKSHPEPEMVAGSIALQSELGAFDPHFHFMYEEEVREGIDHYIEQNHPDLLVIVPGQYSFFSRFFHRSKSKQLIREPLIPVLSLHK